MYFIKFRVRAVHEQGYLGLTLHQKKAYINVGTIVRNKSTVGGCITGGKKIIT